MRSTIVAILTAVLAAPAGVYAEAAAPTANPPVAQSVPGRPGAFRASAIAEVNRMLANESLQAPASGQSSAQESWPKRHPAVTGLLIGAGVGAFIGASTLCPSDGYCELRTAAAAAGAGVGGGLGALTGWLISKAQK